MTFHEYPKAKYRADGLNCVVDNLEEELALDLHVWFDSPAKAKEGYKPAPPIEVVWPESTAPVMRRRDRK